ncbi:MAG: hypothetical protein AB9869_09540 [Verrucomicrobiia bacterium]
MNDPSLTSTEIAAIRTQLDRVLAAVEKAKRPHWIQIARVLVLSLATVASAWCAFQSARWTRLGGAEHARAAQAGRQATEKRVEATQILSFHALMFIQFLAAHENGNQRLAEFLRARFGPVLKPAVEAWLKSEPMKNPAAPESPFKMAEYLQPELQAARQFDDQLQQHLQAASAAGRNGNSYVLLTVLFASVLFFGSLGASLPSPRLQDWMSFMCVVVFLGTVIALLSLPAA